MRRTRGASGRIVNALTACVVVGCAATLTATPSLVADVELTTRAFVADGTTFPDPSPGFVASAVADFISPTVSSADGFDAIGLHTPEEILDISGAAQRGADMMLAAIDQYAQEHPGEPIVMFGYSQSAVSTMLVKATLAAREAAGEDIPNVTFVGIGVGNRPNGGIAERLNGITIPFFHFTFNGAAPTDSGIPTVEIVREYDGLADFPQFPINLVSLANAVIGVISVHALYGEVVSLDPESPKYVEPVKETHGDTTYYTIPTERLPLLDPLRLIGIPEALLDIIEPTLKVIVDAGYDRDTPVWEPTPAQLIPVIDPITFTLQLARGVVDGINNAFKVVGAGLPGYQQISTALGALEQKSAEVIGEPYGDIVRAVNAHLNPFTAFAAVEGPIVRVFDEVLIKLGVQPTLNKVINPVLFPITRWLEDKVLFPIPASQQEISVPRQHIPRVEKRSAAAIADAVGAQAVGTAEAPAQRQTAVARIPGHDRAAPAPDTKKTPNRVSTRSVAPPSKVGADDRPAKPDDHRPTKERHTRALPAAKHQR